MNQAIKLTLEQEFNLRHFTDQVQRMSCKQAQALLIEQHHLMMLRETMYQKLLKRQWQLDVDMNSP